MASSKLRGQTSRNGFHMANMQKKLACFSKGLPLEPLQKLLAAQQCHQIKPINVDEAPRSKAQL
uniref:Uncharacterized protein n=1 Tax=Suricata suricatta TaxID=37032 RepID=A0A673T330_SURSU